MRFTALFILPAILACPVARAAGQAESPVTAILSDYWQDQLRHDPELASALGDQRYDDQLSDYSVQGYNAALDRGRGFIDRLSAIDTASLSATDKEQLNALVNNLVQQQADADSKPWELPITATSGLPLDLPALVAELHFANQQDYDHYLARLLLVPTAFEQITTDLMTGIDDSQVLPKDEIDKIIAQANTIATAKPEESVFAAPLKKFPAGVAAADQASDKEQIVAAIKRQVLPSYARLAKFLQAQYAAHAGTQPPSSRYNPEQHIVIAARAAADQALGNKIDLKAFRAQVETSITQSPDTLSKSLDTWIAKQK
jgi:uncharacterized protein (DUF885 family)